MALQQNIMQCRLYFDKMMEIICVKAKKARGEDKN